MPRELTTEKLKLTFYDRLSDSDLELFYRLPTTEEQVAYDNSLVERKRNKINTTVGDARMKYGSKILTGVGDNSFTHEKNGKIVPLHSREDSECYAPDWKAKVVKMAPDVISKLGFVVFEGSLERADNEDADESDPT